MNKDMTILEERLTTGTKEQRERWCKLLKPVLIQEWLRRTKLEKDE